MGTRQFKDLTGEKFGELEIVKKHGVRGNNCLWECFCHACQKTCFKVTPNIRKYTRSCGCLRTRQGKESTLWQGVGDISKENFNKIFKNAEKRNIAFNISFEFMWQLFLKQDGKCALTKRELVFGRYRRGEITASLDRIDSNKPYDENNVQWVHKDINIAKHALNQQYFIELCKDVAKYN